MGQREMGAAISAELLGLRVFGATFRTPDSQAISPTLTKPQTNRGLTGMSNIIDAAWSTEYDTEAHGRVKDPVILPDFKSGMGLQTSRVGSTPTPSRRLTII